MAQKGAQSIPLELAHSMSRNSPRRAYVCLRCQKRASNVSLEARRTLSVVRSAQNALPERKRAVSMKRCYATVQSDYHHSHGPIPEYDRRIHEGKLRDDEHQRTLIQSLQDLHEMLIEYRPPPVVPPTIESLQPKKKGFLSSLFGKSQATEPATIVPSNLPKGLYMYGDVGSGKTMLMDLFLDTLPPNIKKKTRIHFHNFMQDVHKRLHKVRSQHGYNVDAVPFVAAEIAAESSVLCFDEFQCTDVADAMILRRLMESLMAHGSVVVTTSNRHPTELYKNGIQRQSFIPCINLLQTHLRVINLDSTTDYRKMPKPPSGVYHHPLDRAAKSHADKWFRFLGDFQNDPPHETKQSVWGRDITVPEASGSCAKYEFHDLLGRATGAADYLELMRSYDAFVVTDVPAMTYNERDWARRFITFVDAVYESRAKLVLTTAVPLTQLFLSPDEIDAAMATRARENHPTSRDDKSAKISDQEELKHDMRMLMDDPSVTVEVFKNSNVFSGDEERFAFARALSRLTEMGTQEWVERGLGLEDKGGLTEKEGWQRVRSRWREDSL